MQNARSECAASQQISGKHSKFAVQPAAERGPSPRQKEQTKRCKTRILRPFQRAVTWCGIRSLSLLAMSVMRGTLYFSPVAPVYWSCCCVMPLMNKEPFLSILSLSAASAHKKMRKWMVRFYIILQNARARSLLRSRPTHSFLCFFGQLSSRELSFLSLSLRFHPRTLHVVLTFTFVP